MSQRRVARRDLLLLLALLVPGLIALLGLRPLSVPDEGRYPSVALQMLLSGDFVTPRVNGIPFLDKPALYYWLEAGAIQLFGVSSWSIRLMPALLGVLGVTVVFVTAYRLFSRRAAWWSAAALATNPLYFLASQYADMNIEVAVWVTCALCCFLMARQHPPGSAPWRRLFLLAWLSIGLGVLTKGLIGFVFPGMVVGAWVVLGWRWREMRQWHLLSGAVVAFLVCVPWFVAVQRANPQFLHYFFVYQQFERFTGGGFNNAQPFWFYVPVVLLGSLPWSVWLPAALRDQWRQVRVGREDIASDSRQLLLLWPLLILVFFSVPVSKIVGYILPVLPPLSLLVGDFLARRFPGVNAGPQASAHAQSASTKLLRWFPVLGVTLIAAAIIGAVRLDHSGIRPLAQTLKVAMAPADELMCFRSYYQDVPIYLQRAKPIVVVDDWKDPQILQEDNWRREFYLGLMQQPEAGQWLIDDAEFAHRLAERKPGQRIFVLARSRDEQLLVSRYGFTVLQRLGRQVLLVTAQRAS